ncbi:MAG: hypothetical protein WC130_11305 [Kiritimatiellia bacterium]
MPKLTAVGYIIQDKQATAIYGCGATVDEAWQMVRDGAAPFFDAYGNEKADEDAFVQDFKAYGATAALLAQVKEQGGAIAWAVLDGVAGTLAESETLESLWRRVGGDDWTAADESAWREASNAAIARIESYIAGHLKPGVDAAKYAAELFATAEENGNFRGDDVTGEIAARYSKTGNPVPFTV